jgi:hypothetical protein
MNRHTVVCKTGRMAKDLDPSPRLAAAVTAHNAAKAALKAAKEELALAIADELRAGAKIAPVARYADYVPEHVRRIARAHGIEGDPSRVPPPAPPRRTPAES